jgi:hypothetical protein
MTSRLSNRCFTVVSPTELISILPFSVQALRLSLSEIFLPGPTRIESALDLILRLVTETTP